MRTKLVVIVTALGLLLAAVPASAHHAFAAEFDQNKPIKLQGAVVKWELVRPSRNERAEGPQRQKIRGTDTEFLVLQKFGVCPPNFVPLCLCGPRGFLTLKGFTYAIGLITVWGMIKEFVIRTWSLCGKNLEGKEPLYELSLACLSCCACSYDRGGTTCAASGCCTDSIIRRESTGSRKGLDTAAHARWQAGPSGNMVRLYLDPSGASKGPRRERVLYRRGTCGNLQEGSHRKYRRGGGAWSRPPAGCAF